MSERQTKKHRKKKRKFSHLLGIIFNKGILFDKRKDMYYVENFGPIYQKSSVEIGEYGGMPVNYGDGNFGFDNVVRDDGSSPRTYFDKPFIYVLYNKEFQNIIHLGQVMNPNL